MFGLLQTLLSVPTYVIGDDIAVVGMGWMMDITMYNIATYY